MKTSILSFLFLLLCLTTGLNQAFAQEVKWVDNIDSAKIKAFAQHKIILISFDYDLNEMMERLKPLPSDYSPATGVAFTETRVTRMPNWNLISLIELSNKFICVRVKAGTELYLRSKYYSNGKTAIFLDPFEQEINAEQFTGSAKFSQIMQSLPGDATQLYALMDRVKEHPDSIDLKLSLTDQCQLFRAYTISEKYYKELMKSTRMKADSSFADHVQSRHALNYFLKDDYDEAEDLLTDYVEDYPHSSERPMQLFLLVKIYVTKNKKSDAKEYFEILEKEFPANQHTGWARDLIKSLKD